MRFIGRRLVTLVPTLLAVLTLVFVLVRVVPGNPALILLGDQATPEAIARFYRETGLDQPIWHQYLSFLGQIARGDLGRSMINDRPVTSAIAEVLPYTLELSIAGVVVGVLLGVPLGVVAARSNGGWVDWLVRIVTLGGLSFPAFVSPQASTRRSAASKKCSLPGSAATASTSPRLAAICPACATITREPDARRP